MKSYNDMTPEELKSFFAWRVNNRWFSRSRGKWNQTLEHPSAISDKTYEKYHRKTTEELIEEFLKNQ